MTPSSRHQPQARNDPRARFDGRFDDRAMDARLRRAFAGLDAPPPLEAAPAPRAASGRRVSLGLIAAAVGLFVLCAALPTILVRWEPGLRLWELSTPWILRLAPALALGAWMWLERPPAVHEAAARSTAG